MYTLLKDLLITNVEQLFNEPFRLDDERTEQLSTFAENLVKFGSIRGLTSLANPESIVRELIVDSLSGVKFLAEGDSVADLGSGGGIPGLPLAIMRPDCHFVLVESQNRKVAWINEQIADLGLEDRVSALAMRIEDVGRDKLYREKFNVVTAKALSTLPSLIELALPLLQVNGALLAYKAIKAEQEMAASQAALKALSGVIEEKFAYSLGDRQRTLCVIRKQKPTTKQFPRRMGMAQHNPLG